MGESRSHDQSSRSHESQSYDRSSQHAREPYRNGELRSDGRISTQGRVRSYTRERDGYRVYLDRGNYSYWVPESRFRGHRLAVGLELRLGGIFHGGLINVDILGWPGDRYYNDPYYNEGYGNDPYYNDSYGSGSQTGYLRGVVDRVDFRSGSLWLVDESSRRLVTVDLRSIDRRFSRLDLSDLRRGDRVALTGDWIRGGLFDALRIDSIDAS